MKEKDEIKDLFKGSFDSFEVTPPASVKINVDQKISQIQLKRKLKWYLFAGISIFLLALTVLLFSQGENKATNANLASKEISEYGDKTKLASYKGIEHKLNSPSSKKQTNQITNNSSKTL